MKRLLLITGFILISCVLAGHAAAPPAASPQETAVTTPSATAAQGYVVRDSAGKIAVFRKGETRPMLTTTTRTESLPRADAQKLRKGIEAQNKQELEKILEDFCS